MERLVFRAEPFVLVPERELDSMFFTDRAGAVSRGRKLQQTHTQIRIIKRTDGNFQVDASDKVPAPATFPFDDGQTFAVADDVVKRAEVLRAYGFQVKTVKRDSKWFCRLESVATGGPALPMAIGIDAANVFDAEKSAKKRAVRLAKVGFGVTVFQRTDNKWQVKITNLPTYVATPTPSKTTTTKTPVPAPPTASKTTSTTPAPPHKLVEVTSGDWHTLSDAVVQSYRDFAADVLALTGQSIDTTFGDTIRPLDMKGSADRGSDNFSWHKAGRAVDINQDLPWVIVEQPGTDGMYFRVYLKHKDQTTTTGVKKFPAGTAFYYKPWKVIDPKWAFVDITAVAGGHGWLRIKAQPGYESNAKTAEWWHFQKTDGLTWFQALRELYTDTRIRAAVKTFASTNQHSARLKTEGFDDATLRSLFAPVKRGNLELRCPVGTVGKATNLVDDVRAVQRALIRGNKLPAGSETGRVDRATQSAINAVQATVGRSRDGVIEVGLKLHDELGKL